MPRLKWIAVGNRFLDPYWDPEVEIIRRAGVAPPLEELRELFDQHRDALCLWSMNTGSWGDSGEQRVAAKLAKELGIPSVWQTCEDPNGIAEFVGEAFDFDYVFTSDRYCIPQYQQRGAHNAFWLPLAAQPIMHFPLPMVENPADFVLIANHYPHPSKVAALENLFLPLVRAGYGLALFSYANSPWPDEIKKFWRAATSCYDVAQFYPEGRIALGSNCQEFNTTMTSMRTFEVLACGKPFLAWHSEAYEELGFVNGTHFVWTSSAEKSLSGARGLLAASPDEQDRRGMAPRGREFVLKYHTYARRLEYMQYVLGGGRDLLEFR